MYSLLCLDIACIGSCACALWQRSYANTGLAPLLSVQLFTHQLLIHTIWKFHEDTFQIKSNQISFEDTIISVKRDYKAGQPALTVALNTIKDETQQHKIRKLNKLHGNIYKWSQYTIIKHPFPLGLRDMLFEWVGGTTGSDNRKVVGLWVH